MNCGTLASNTDAMLIVVVTAIVFAFDIADCCCRAVSLLQLSGKKKVTFQTCLLKWKGLKSVKPVSVN